MSHPEPIVRLACRAMNTRFEVVLWGREPDYLTSAGEEALQEIQRLDAQLSFYRDDSDLRLLNVAAAQRPVPVDPRLFRLLERARELSVRTGGAFDPTIAPLLRAWGLTGEGGRVPEEAEIAAARHNTGANLLELDAEAVTVRFARPGMLLDLGAIGKGYAVERAAELVRDYEVPGALLHGGTSSVYALGSQPDGSDWTIALRDPTAPDGLLGSVSLRDQALSVSGSHGKYFVDGETRFGHVLDPRAGRPVQGGLLAAVRSPSATDSDALSTALLVRGAELLPLLDGFGAGALLLERDEGGGTRLSRLGL